MLGAVSSADDTDVSDEKRTSKSYGNEFDGDEVEDDLVFSTVPQRVSAPTTTQIHFDEIDEHDPEDNDAEDDVDNDNDLDDDDQLCHDYALKMQTPTKSAHIENKKRKQRCIEDLDALLNDDDQDEHQTGNHSDQQHQQMSPVFKKKP
jgi:hypothetical protein